jgi:Photosynthetic reaction centre cytochrome C subunit
MVCFRHVVGALGVVVLTSAIAAAQAPAGGGQRAGGAPPAPPKNLQVLPKDTPAPQVVALMRTFNAGLGVQCSYCHAYVAPGDPTNDMAADTKTPKLVARVMLQMTSEINAKLAANIKKPAEQITRVECATCHRGAAIPVLPPAAAPAGAPPAAPGR